MRSYFPHIIIPLSAVIIITLVAASIDNQNTDKKNIVTYKEITSTTSKRKTDLTEVATTERKPDLTEVKKDTAVESFEILKRLRDTTIPDSDKYNLIIKLKQTDPTYVTDEFAAFCYTYEIGKENEIIYKEKLQQEEAIRNQLSSKKLLQETEASARLEKLSTLVKNTQYIYGDVLQILDSTSILVTSEPTADVIYVSVQDTSKIYDGDKFRAHVIEGIGFEYNSLIGARKKIRSYEEVSFRAVIRATGLDDLTKEEYNNYLIRVSRYDKR